MILDFFGKLLFPRQAPWQQRKQLVNLIATICVATLAAGMLVAMMLFINSKKL
jgi:flagellar basal body-associated protein FliL